MQRITPFLWFDTQAEEAMNFYTSVFKNSKVGEVSRYGEDAPIPADTVMTANFELDGLKLTALNGGPEFKFNEAISFVIPCKDQEEIDYYWSKLTSNGGQESQCGWLKDKFGVSWQVIPENLGELISNPKSMQAMLQMKKIEIEKLKQD